MIGVHAVSVWDLMTKDASTMRKFIDFFSTFLRIYPTTAMMLFCVLAHLISLHLHNIRLQIERQLIDCRRSNSPLLESQRHQLNVTIKKYHLRISKAVYSLNNFFGFHLLSEVMFIFVGTTNCLMFVMIGYLTGDGLLIIANSAIFIDLTIHLVLIATFSEKISNEV